MTPNGTAIRAIRESKGISLRQLAGATGLHRSFISRVERGLSNASADSLRGIAAALAVSTKAITREEMT